MPAAGISPAARSGRIFIPPLRPVAPRGFLRSAGPARVKKFGGASGPPLAFCGGMWYGKQNAVMERVRCLKHRQREGRRRLKAARGNRQGKFTPERRG